MPPGASPSALPSALTYMPSGPQWMVWGRLYPARLAISSGSIVFTTLGARGSGLVSIT